MEYLASGQLKRTPPRTVRDLLNADPTLLLVGDALYNQEPVGENEVLIRGEVDLEDNEGFSHGRVAIKGVLHCGPIRNLDLTPTEILQMESELRQYWWSEKQRPRFLDGSFLKKLDKAIRRSVRNGRRK